jgi:hypothetical protein
LLQVKFHMPFLILTALYHGISNGHTEYEFQILSKTRDIALWNSRSVNRARALEKFEQITNTLVSICWEIWSKHYSVETTCSLIRSNVVLLDKGQVAENLLKWVIISMFVSLYQGCTRRLRTSFMQYPPMNKVR